MPTPTQRKNAEADTKIKMKEERKLARQMTAQFNDISDQAQTHYVSNKTVLDLSIFVGAIALAIKNHYFRVAKIFVDRINKSGIKLTKQESELLENTLSKAAGVRGDFASNEIIKSLQKDLNASFDKVRQEAIDNNITLTIRQTAVNSIAKFRNTVMSRAKSTIPMTETQTAAESAKLSTATATQNSTNNTKIKAFFGEWVTKRDDRVRPFHVEADGQQRPIGEPFLVGGELLLHPGDGSLGATPGNLIRCRCSLQIL